MSIKLTWLGHGGWLIECATQRIALDPFLTNCPTAPMTADQLAADLILVSHGHADHISDVPQIAQKNQAQVVAIFEIATWLQQQQGVANTLGMNIGGRVRFPWGVVQMTQAWHSSQLPDGSDGGQPAGFLLTLEDRRLYFACDTGLFSDMQLIGQAGLDLAVLPIGDLFTMGPEDSVQAVQLLQPRKVAPAHYNTWPPIAQNAERWAEMVRTRTQAEPLVVAPGEAFTI